MFGGIPFFISKIIMEKKDPFCVRQTGSFIRKMSFTNTQFNTKPTLIKRSGRKILGLYPAEKLARKMTQANHVLHRPAGLTIDAGAYNLYIASNLDWKVVFEINDGRSYWISVPEFNQHKLWIDRGQGPQYVIQFKYLHLDGDSGASIDYGSACPPIKLDKPRSSQLSLFGGEIW